MQSKYGLKVANELVRFVEERALPRSGITSEAFWAGLADLYARFAPQNQALLQKRDTLQLLIDDWYRTPAGQQADGAATAAFLREMGYLVDEPAPFTIAPERVDDEVCALAGIAAAGLRAQT